MLLQMQGGGVGKEYSPTEREKVNRFILGV